MRILVVQESDWGKKGPHQQHHLFERMQMKGHEIVIIDYETFWKKNRHRGIIARRKEYIATGKVLRESKLRVIRPMMLRVPLLCYLSLLLFHNLEIRRQIKEFKPDVIVGWGILNSLSAARIANGAGIPFVYYVIDSLHTLIPEKFIQFLGHFIESRIPRRSQMIFVINKGLADYVVSLGGVPQNVFVISAGIDTARMNPLVDGSPIREKYGIKPDDQVLFFMGNMFPFSGLKELAETLLDTPQAPHIKMLLLGRGDLFDVLETLNEDPRSKGRIILVDWVEYKDVPKYIAASDFCLLPAHLNEVMRDIVPIKTYEYLACGKPLIATKLPGIMKEFGTGNGVVYVNSARDVISLVLDLTQDENTVKTISAAASSFVAPLTWTDLTSEFERRLVMAII